MVDTEGNECKLRGFCRVPQGQLDAGCLRMLTCHLPWWEVLPHNHERGLWAACCAINPWGAAVWQAALEKDPSLT